MTVLFGLSLYFAIGLILPWFPVGKKQLFETIFRSFLFFVPLKEQYFAIRRHQSSEANTLTCIDMYHKIYNSEVKRRKKVLLEMIEDGLKSFRFQCRIARSCWNDRKNGARLRLGSG